jgi:hypothetical protein
MSVTFQLSDKRGDAILLVKAEGPGAEVDAIYSAFGAAVQDAGLESSLAAFGTGLVQAVAVAQPLTQPQGYVQQPAVQQYAQPAPQAAPAMPGAVLPSCQHGQKKIVRSKPGSSKTWVALGCVAGQNDPTKCNPGLDFDAARDLGL